MTDEEQKTEWMYSIFNKDKIMAQKEQWTKEAEEAGMTLAEYLESINPLKQYSYEDYISRQAVLDEISDYNNDLNYTTNELYDRIKRMSPIKPHYTDAEIQKIQEMEQAEIQKAYELGKASQSKIGHWVLKRTFPTRHYNEDLIDYECSECGRRIRCTNTQLVNYPYCHCGAKMREGRNERTVEGTKGNYYRTPR